MKHALHAAALVSLLGVAVLASPGLASTGEPVVYYSPDGSGDPPSSAPALISPLDDQPIHLYIDYENSPDVGSSTSGSMCTTANGDETCGFDVLLELLSDGGSFAGFTPASANIQGHLEPATATSPATLRVNGIDTDGMLIPAEIGTLWLDAADANQLQIQVKGMHRVGAAGQLDAIQQRVIVQLPEPALAAQLASGLLALAGLARRRARSRSRTTPPTPR